MLTCFSICIEHLHIFFIVNSLLSHNRKSICNVGMSLYTELPMFSSVYLIHHMNSLLILSGHL